MSECEPSLPIFLSPEPLMTLLTDKSASEAAETLGCNRTTILRYREKKYRIHFVKADQYAIALGMHPQLIWGDEWSKVDQPR